MRAKLRFDPMWLAIGFAVVAPLFLGALANWQAMPEILKRLGGQTAAAWVQAIGSVAAIVATWAATTRAHRLEAHGRQQADEEFYRSVLRATVRFFQSTADIPRFRDEPSHSLIAAWISGADQTLRRLNKVEALPISSWPSAYIGVEFDAYMQRARHLHAMAVGARNALVTNAPSAQIAFPVFAAWQSYMRQHREFLDLLRPYLPAAEIMEYRRWEDGAIQ